MAKDNSSENNNLSTPTAKRQGLRSKPYDANNSFVKKVATRVSDLIPQRSWIRQWFNNSQDEGELQTTEKDDTQFEMYEEKQTQPPPTKRPCIRMDVTYPPGTFEIKKRNSNEGGSSKEQFSNHNESTQDFLEPTATGPRLPRFVSSTPAYQMNTNKAPDPQSTLNMLMSEQNNGATNGNDDNSESSESTSGCSSLIPQNNRQQARTNINYSSSFTNKRRYIDEKLSFTNHLQSPRSLFLDRTARETLSSRQPSFNPSVVNNTTLERSASLSSPFYPGNTMFGGANAANLYRRGSSVLSETSFHMRAPQRASVEVNQTNESVASDRTGMGQTARRIMEALEQFSSPLSDAKKMPVGRNVMDGTRNSSILDTSCASSTMLSRKRQREDETASPRVGLRHLTRELMVPTVPDLLRIRRRQKLQNTTANARKIMSARSATTAPVSQEYHIRTESEKELEPKRRTQLKANKKSNLDEEETIEPVNLPTMPLPISSLPRFEISLPQCTKPVTTERPQQQVKSDKDDAFKFASPIRLADGAKNLESMNNFTFSKPISPSKISTTLMTNESSQDLSKTLSIDSNETLSSVSSFPNFIWAGPSQSQLKPKNKEAKNVPKIASELKSGSVMDFFAKKSLPATTNDSSNVWECNECLIKNNENESHCVACKSSRPTQDDSSDIEILECPNDDQASKSRTPSPEQPKSTKSLGKSTSSPSVQFKFNAPFATISTTSLNSTPMFGIEQSKPETLKTTSDIINKASPLTPSKSETSPLLSNTFKPSKSSWECPCCMVHNVDTVTTCPCCNTAKPGTINVSPKRMTASMATSTSSASTITSGFGDKFKKPEGSWSCDTCMVQNKSEATKCAACETPRPGAAKPAALTTTTTSTFGSGFGDKFKKLEGSWSCDICMVQNKPDVTKCVACETAKPGCEGITKSSSNLQFKIDVPVSAAGFKFGIDKAADSAAANLPKTNGFTFGNSAAATAPAATGGFNFGISSSDKNKEDDVNSKSIGLDFKAPTETVAATATFQFGTKPAETNDKEEEKKSMATATFSFGMPAKSDTKSAMAGFVFGASAKREDKEKSEKPVVATGFTFGASATVTKDSTTEKESKPVAETPVASNFLFGSPKPAIDLQFKEPAKKDDETKPTASKIELTKTTPTFGAPVSDQQQQKPIATPNFSFAASTAAPTSTSSSSTGLFGFPAKPSESAPLPAFGSPAAPKPVFSFNKPAETTTSTSQQQPQTENKASTLAFGSPAPSSAFSSQTNQTAPSLFGNIGASSIPAASTSETKPFTFGAPENKIAPAFGEPEKKLPAFGAPATDNKPVTGGFSSPTAAATPAFGTPTTAMPSPFGSSTSVFGSATPSTFGTNVTPSIFSTTKPNETTSTNPGLFTFGQSSQQTASASSGFNFSAGSNASAVSDQPKPAGIFTFGASSGASSGAPVGNGFGSGGFGASTPAPAAASTFTFNAPPKPAKTVAASSGFGQPATTPMFNAPTAQPAGLPPPYPGTANPGPSTSGFNFNTNMPSSFNFSGTPAPAATGGFSFNAPTGALANPPTFDPNVTPTFNFTAGSGAPTTFNAPPASAAPARKIKKAVRRMPRQ